MTAPISDVVQVSVTTTGAAVQSAGFGIGLILGIFKQFAERVRSYASTAEMVADGFSSTDEVYKAAAAYLSQSPAPTRVKIGRRSADVVNIAITAVNTFLYSLKINGVAYTYTSDGSATQAEIGAGLIAAYNAAVSGLVMTYSTGVLTLTGTTNLDFSVNTLSANLAFQTLAASDVLGDDLDACLLYDPDFYGVVGTDRSSANQQLIVTWAAANKKLAFVSTQEAGVVDTAVGSDTTSLAAILHTAAQDRAVVFYHAAANANYIDAAGMGRVLALKPGAYTFDFKDLTGIAASSLTSTQRANAAAKKCNVIESRGGLNQVHDGWVASGKFVDQIHGRDWLANEIAVNIFAALSAPLKVPYTDGGIAIVDAAARQAGSLGVTRGYLESFSTSFPKKSEISSVNRANRVLVDGKMVAQEAGAIHSVIYELNVQV